MLWALGQPAALAGLLASFLAAMALRGGLHYLAAGRPGGMRWWDPFGAVGAALGGVGWGPQAVPPIQRRTGVLLAGPALMVVAGLLVLAAYRGLGMNQLALELYTGVDVLRGIPGPAADQFVLSLGVGLVGNGFLALVPLPPLDGWGLLTRLVRRPGLGFQKAQYWLDEQNIGVAILLGGLLLPLIRGVPLVLYLLDFLLTPIIRAFSG